MNKKGFTLIEMLAVIAIIAVLVAIIVPAVGSSAMEARGAADAANLRALTAKAAAAYLDSEVLPAGYVLDSQVAGEALAVTFVLEGGELFPTVTIGGDDVTIDYFAWIAREGTAEGAPIYNTACSHLDEDADGVCDLCGESAA